MTSRPLHRRPTPTATSGSSRRRCGRARSTRSSGRSGSASSSRCCSRPRGPPAGARPRAALRPAGARQDDAGDDHRRRDERAAAADQRTGDHARRRPRGDPVRPQRGRRALRRRDPPDVAAGRGDALHGDGGLPGRRHHRQGPGRDRHPAGDPAVHPGRRDHPGRAAARARCATGSGSPRTWSSTSPPTSSGSCGARPACSTSSCRPDGAARDRPPVAGDAADRQPAAAPGARLRPGARRRRRHPRPGPRRPLELFEVDESGLDRLDRAVLDVLCRRFGGGPVGVSTLAVAVGEERETVEEVAEPFLVRTGLLARTPRGRVATGGRLGAPRSHRTESAWNTDSTLFDDESD